MCNQCKSVKAAVTRAMKHKIVSSISTAKSIEIVTRIWELERKGKEQIMREYGA